MHRETEVESGVASLDQLADEVKLRVQEVNASVEAFFQRAETTRPDARILDHLYVTWDRTPLTPFFPEYRVFLQPMLLFKPAGSGLVSSQNLRRLQSWLQGLDHEQGPRYDDARTQLTTSLHEYHDAYVRALDRLRPQRLLPRSRYQSFVPDLPASDPLIHLYLVYPTKVVATRLNRDDYHSLSEPPVVVFPASSPFADLFASEEGREVVAGFYAPRGQAAYTVQVHPRINPRHAFVVAGARRTPDAQNVAGALLERLQNDLAETLSVLDSRQGFSYGICVGQPGSDYYADFSQISLTPTLGALLQHPSLVPAGLLPPLLGAPSPAEMHQTCRTSRVPVSTPYALLAPAQSSGPVEIVHLSGSSVPPTSGYLS